MNAEETLREIMKTPIVFGLQSQDLSQATLATLHEMIAAEGATA